jgi:hypothetical protein
MSVILLIFVLNNLIIILVSLLIFSPDNLIILVILRIFALNNLIMLVISLILIHYINNVSNITNINKLVIFDLNGLNIDVIHNKYTISILYIKITISV